MAEETPSDVIAKAMRPIVELRRRQATPALDTLRDSMLSLISEMNEGRPVIEGPEGLYVSRLTAVAVAARLERQKRALQDVLTDLVRCSDEYDESEEADDRIADSLRRARLILETMPME